MGKISSLPISIHSVKTKVEISENGAKFPVGPQIPVAGPMLPIQDSTAVKVSSNANLTKKKRAHLLMKCTKNTIRISRNSHLIEY